MFDGKEPSATDTQFRKLQSLIKPIVGKKTPTKTEPKAETAAPKSTVSKAKSTLQLPQKYLERLFSTKGRPAQLLLSRREAEPEGVQKLVRMVDSETQTSDDLLEDLLLQKLKEAYENQAKEDVKTKRKGGKKVELDFKKV